MVEVAPLDGARATVGLAGRSPGFHTGWLSIRTCSGENSRWILNSKAKNALSGRSPQMWFFGHEHRPLGGGGELVGEDRP